MSKILVPIDFTEVSVHALQYAIMMAERLRAGIRMVHVIREKADYDVTFDSHDYDRVFRAGIEENFERFMEQYEGMVRFGLDFRIHEGCIFCEICNVAKYTDIDLIVMGTNGVSGFNERWKGSNSFRVASNAPSPVITIRNDFDLRPLKRIIMPIDLSSQSRQKVPEIIYLSRLFGASVSIVGIPDKKGEKKLKNNISQVESFFESKKVSYNTEYIPAKDIANALIEFGILNDADLIAIMTNPKESIRDFWATPVAQKMVNHSPIPVISFHPNRFYL